MWIRGSRSVIERIIALLLLAVAMADVSLARLRLGSHWPTDIAAGMIIGAVWLIVVILALRRAEAAGGR
jgi:undecaprenyl-diphosphatase